LELHARCPGGLDLTFDDRGRVSEDGAGWRRGDVDAQAVPVALDGETEPATRPPREADLECGVSGQGDGSDPAGDLLVQVGFDHDRSAIQKDAAARHTP